MAQGKRRKRATRRRKSGGNRLQRIKRALLVVGILAALGYTAAIYYFVVMPYGSRWKAIYGGTKAPEGYTIHGIDISHHQGAIDWERLQKARIGDEPLSFVFVKATEGQSVLDANFNDNFYEAREHGFIRGAYHYFSPGVSPRLQAEYYLHQAKLEDGDLAPVLDIEEAGALSAEELKNAALVWLQIVEKKHKTPPIIYTNYKFKLQYLSGKEFDRYPYWIAHYYVDKLEYKGQWKFWQYTDSGRLLGIRGNVDCNVYNGSMYDLKQLTIRTE